MKQLFTFILISVLLMEPVWLKAQKFIHPGIDQTIEDLVYMKKQVQLGAQPWKDAFERLKAGIDLTTVIKSFTHVKHGRYGRPNIGGEELRLNIT